jgi:competence protein ComEC
VHAVGFWLSVSATAGIVVLGAPLGARLPGPRPIAAALGVTLAAQVAVAPLTLAVFGTVPLVGVAANLVAAPAAGPVMVVGLPATAVAAALPDGVAALVQVPSLLLVRWVAFVARVGASAPLPSNGVLPLLVLVASVLLVLRRPPRAPL